ncbi:hypothetical protein TELCIR_06391, partial [Teladorsagia circumcincta]
MTSPTAHRTTTPISSNWLKDATELKKPSQDKGGEAGEATEVKTEETTVLKKVTTTITTTPPLEGSEPGKKPSPIKQPAPSKPEAEEKQPAKQPRLSPDYNPQRDYNPVCDCTNCGNMRQYRLEQGLCDCYDCIMALHKDIDTPSCREHQEKQKRTPIQSHERQAPRVRAKGSYPWVKRLTKVQQP